jgi:hypothetical protein
MKQDHFSPDMSLTEREKKLLEMTDDDIDYSDIPPLDDEFFNQATLIKPSAKPKPIIHK